MRFMEVLQLYLAENTAIFGPSLTFLWREPGVTAALPSRVRRVLTGDYAATPRPVLTKGCAATPRPVLTKGYAAMPHPVQTRGYAAMLRPVLTKGYAYSTEKRLYE
eukprot:1462810-Rhodomonas_salina.1